MYSTLGSWDLEMWTLSFPIAEQLQKSPEQTLQTLAATEQVPFGI